MNELNCVLHFKIDFFGIGLFVNIDEPTVLVLKKSCKLRLLQTFVGVLQKKSHTRTVFNEPPQKIYQ